MENDKKTVRIKWHLFSEYWILHWRILRSELIKQVQCCSHVWKPNHSFFWFCSLTSSSKIEKMFCQLVKNLEWSQMWLLKNTLVVLRYLYYFCTGENEPHSWSSMPSADTHATLHFLQTTRSQVFQYNGVMGHLRTGTSLAHLFNFTMWCGPQNNWNRSP